MTEDIGGDGGFLVPPQFLSTVMDIAIESEIVRPNAMFVPMTGSQFTVPLLRDYNHSAGSVGGFTARWGKETGTNTAQKATLGFRTHTANKLAIYADVSSELATDAPNFDAFMGGAPKVDRLRPRLCLPDRRRCWHAPWRAQ